MKNSFEKIFNLNTTEKTVREEALEIIIVSDNHSEKNGLVKVLAHHTSADYFLHCGDSNLEADLDLMRPFITVRGNTDFWQDYPNDEKIKLATGEQIWMTHGHRFSVNGGTDKLLMKAKKMSRIPAIILYGHTHKVDVNMQEDILIINPGSIALPRDGYRCTYARLRITPGCYEVQILDISDHVPIKEFQFPRSHDHERQVPL